MFAKVYSAAALALAASTLVSGQTSTKCNPTEKSCPADPGVGKDGIECDFTKGECDDFVSAEGTDITYNGQGAVFTIEKESNAPTINTNKYIFFGRVDVEVQAADGQGIVTSSVLQSDDLDEIDWEWVGGDNEQVQTNYFGKGDTTTYDRGAYHPVSSPLTTTHTYTIDWTSEKVDWKIDGNTVRTLKYSDAQGGSRFPQTPMQVKLGTWVAGGKDTAKGTVEWAGGYTDFSQAPFNAYYKKITITDYAGGNSATKDGIKEYTYGDKTGSFESIDVKKGESSDDGGDDDSSSTTQGSETSTEASESTATSGSETSSDEETTATASNTSAFTTSTTAADSTSSSGSGSGSGSGSETSGSSSGGSGGSGTSGAAATETAPGEGAAARGTVAAGAAALVGLGALAQLL